MATPWFNSLTDAGGFVGRRLWNEQLHHGSAVDETAATGCYVKGDEL